MMPDREDNDRLTISDLFPEGSRILLTGSGKDFVERIGIETARRAVLNVMIGENLRDQTEPFTRRRIAELNGAVIAMFVKGHLEIPDFTSQVSAMAIRQIQTSKKNDKVRVWPAQWLIGL